MIAAAHHCLARVSFGLPQLHPTSNTAAGGQEPKKLAHPCSLYTSQGPLHIFSLALLNALPLLSLNDPLPGQASSPKGCCTTLSREKDTAMVSRISSAFSSATSDRSWVISLASCVRICSKWHQSNPQLHVVFHDAALDS